MRIFELALSIISLITVIYSIFNLRKKDNKNYRALVVLIPLFIAHVLFEGIRWQMFGVYLYSLYLIYRFIFTSRKRLSIGEAGEKKLPAWFFCVLIIISIGLISIFQVHDMPEITGEYEIGTISFDITDKSREELYGSRKGELRKYRAQIWYPSDDVSNGELTKWLSDGLTVSRQVPAQIGLPGFLFDYSGLIDSNSYEGVLISSKEEKYPVVILSHGWTGYRHLHSDMAELLASHGYIAVSIEHTYGSLATVFEDGEVALVDPNALPNREETEDFLDYANDLVTTYGKDSGLVIDFIEELNNTSLFDNRADMEQVGALGHSTGGGGVVKLAIEDERVKAIMGFDPWVEPIGHEQLEEGLNIPSLFFRSEQWEVGFNNEYLTTLVNNSSVKPLTYQLDGSYHQDFTMLYMYNPVNQLAGFSGDLDSQTSLDIRLDYILKFFDENLKGIDNNVAKLVETYEPMKIVEY